jgi:hypothetical protein
LRSSRLAREPSFVTFVLELTLSGLSLPERVSVFFDLSNFFTLPWTAWRPEVSLEAVEPAVAPLVSLEPVEDEPVPMLEEPVDEPVVPWLVSLLDPGELVLGELVLGELVVLPLLPLEPVLPLLPLCAKAWLARMTTPAAARPKPHPIFFI